jgi:hypothetical protein
MVVIKLWFPTSVSFRILEVQEDEFFGQEERMAWSWPVSRSYYAIYMNEILKKKTTISYS